MTDAQEALTRLQEGNQRFVAGKATADPLSSKVDPGSQSPFAVILGCSDSRVPAEYVFDQGVGDLFVIRVAGNIAAPSQIGSVEFAASKFGTRLVVVLGHSHCGAVSATLDAIRQGAGPASENLASIVDRVRPAVGELGSTYPNESPDELVAHGVRANVRASVKHLRDSSEVLSSLMDNEGLRIVGAEYSLETRVVDFFDSEASPN